MDRTDKLILSRLSRAFPLAPQPYAVLGAELGLSAAEVLAASGHMSEEQAAYVAAHTAP